MRFTFASAYRWHLSTSSPAVVSAARAGWSVRPVEYAEDPSFYRPRGVCARRFARKSHP